MLRVRFESPEAEARVLEQLLGAERYDNPLDFLPAKVWHGGLGGAYADVILEAARTLDRREALLLLCGTGLK